MAQQLSGMHINTTGFNPQYEQVQVAFQAAEEGFATLVVYDPKGGWLLSLGETRIHPGANTLSWPGCDSEGQPVPNGRYTLELFGFDMARRPGSAPALRAQVIIKISPGNDEEQSTADLSLYWPPALGAPAYTACLYGSG